MENLYGALSQKAFKGELDLSRVVVPTDQKEPSEKKTVVEPVVPEKDSKVTIVLPAQDNLDSLNSTEGCKAVITQWLDSYLEQLDGIPFSAEHFMETAQERVWELIEDDAPELGMAAYDQLKKWLLLSLESGRLVQTYDDTGNCVEILPAKG